MKNQYSNEETIDLYLKGELSEEEASTFEKQLEEDPLLQQEFAFQSSVVESIRENRKHQLKSRLDNINISTYQKWQNIKHIVTTIGSAAIVITSGYAVFNEFSKSTSSASENSVDNTKQEINISGNQQNLAFDIPDKPMPKGYEKGQDSQDNNKAGHFDKENATEQNTPSQNNISDNTNQVNAENVTSDSIDSGKEENQAQVAKPVKPDINAGSEEAYEDSFEANDPSNEEDSFLSSIEKDRIEVEFAEGKSKYDFHYKFTNKKLFLYGNFDEEKYEILALKENENGKKLFLKYKNKYYRINPTDKIKPFKQIKSKELKNELEIISQEKADN